MNIGPWWIYDTIILLILVASTVYGGWKGFFGVVYFLIGEVIILIIIFVISKVITNFIDNEVTSYVYKKYDIESLFKFVNSVEDSLLSKINFSGDGSSPTFTDKGIIPDFIDFFISETVWAVMFIALWFILNIVLLVLYICVFSKKKRKFSINKYIRITLGSIIGFGTGLVFAYPIYAVASFPLFQNTSMNIAKSIDSSESTLSEDETYSYIANGNYGTILSYIESSIEEQEAAQEKTLKSNMLTFDSDSIVNKLKEWAGDTNSFDNRALTAKIYSSFRMSKNYLYSGIAKYIVEPLSTLIQNTKNNFNFESLKEKLQHIDDVIVKGYCETSISNIPIAYWIELLPTKARPAVRMMLESFLDIAAVSTGYVGYKDSDDDDSKRTGFASMFVLNDELGKYKASHGNKRLTERDFVDFYNSTPGNEFKIGQAYMKEDNLDDRYIYWVLGDPAKLYTFLKNLYQINMAYSAPGTFPFLANIYTALFLVRGMEIVPSGDYFKGVFGMDDGTDLIHGTKYFVLANYLDFIDSEYM